MSLYLFVCVCVCFFLHRTIQSALLSSAALSTVAVGLDSVSGGVSEVDDRVDALRVDAEIDGQPDVVRTEGSATPSP